MPRSADPILASLGFRGIPSPAGCPRDSCSSARPCGCPKQSQAQPPGGSWAVGMLWVMPFWVALCTFLLVEAVFSFVFFAPRPTLRAMSRQLKHLYFQSWIESAAEGKAAAPASTAGLRLFHQGCTCWICSAACRSVCCQRAQLHADSWNVLRNLPGIQLGVSDAPASPGPCQGRTPVHYAHLYSSEH